MNNEIKNQIYSEVNHDTSLQTGWYDTIVSMSARLTLPLSFVVCKTFNMPRHSVSLYIIGDSKFKSELE